MDYPQITRNLALGAQGADVKQLQEWLKSQGYFPANQPTTNNFGPITQKAVQGFQDAKGIKDSTPGVFGPASQNFFTQEGVKAKNALGVPKKSDQPKAPTPDEMKANLRSIGVSDDVINTLNPNDVSFFAGLGNTIVSSYNQGKTVPPIMSTEDLDTLLKVAQNDPTINDFYKTALTNGTKDFQTNLGLLQGDYTQKQAEDKAQFDTDQKALAESYASAGLAMSGFRNKAKENLDLQESGIVQSSRRTLQTKLNTLGSSFEKTYGSDALKNVGSPQVGDVKYDAYGNIVGGTQGQSKLLDIRDKQDQLIGDTTTLQSLTGTGGTKVLPPQSPTQQ